MKDVQAAADIKLVKAENRAQNERKYRSSDREHQDRHMYVSV